MVCCHPVATLLPASGEGAEVDCPGPAQLDQFVTATTLHVFPAPVRLIIGAPSGEPSPRRWEEAGRARGALCAKRRLPTPQPVRSVYARLASSRNAGLDRLAAAAVRVPLVAAGEGSATTSLPAGCHRVPHGECDGANLRDANLLRANLEHAVLNRGNLSGASLNYAHLTHSHLNGAHMNYSDLERMQRAQASFERGRASDAAVRCSPVGGRL